MTIGKNKITYADFDWHVYKAPHFDVHYYPEVEPFLEDIVSYSESAYLDLSKNLDHELTIRVPMREQFDQMARSLRARLSEA